MIAKMSNKKKQHLKHDFCNDKKNIYKNQKRDQLKWRNEFDFGIKSKYFISIYVY